MGVPSIPAVGLRGSETRLAGGAPPGKFAPWGRRLYSSLKHGEEEKSFAGGNWRILDRVAYFTVCFTGFGRAAREGRRGEGVNQPERFWLRWAKRCRRLPLGRSMKGAAELEGIASEFVCWVDDPAARGAFCGPFPRLIAAEEMEEVLADFEIGGFW